MPGSRLLDVDYPWAVFVLLAAATALTVVVAATTSTAAFSTYNAAWDGASALRAQANAVDTEPHVVTDTNAYRGVPSDTTVAVILSPDRAYQPSEAARINRFVATGGTLVVADDFGPHANPLLAAVGAGARIDGRLLRDDRFHYRSSAMPVARVVSNQSFTHGSDRVTLNHGTAVEPNTATVIASTSGFAYVDTDRDGRIDDDETLDAYPVATVERIGDGRVVVIGDPSALINIMLERPGNQAFVRGLFGVHDRVLLDYSHTSGVPPVEAGVLLVRDSVLLQLAIGLAALGSVVVWARRPALREWVRAIGGREPAIDPPTLRAEDLETVIAHRHPEWESQRIERVVHGLMLRRDKEGRDD